MLIRAPHAEQLEMGDVEEVRRLLIAPSIQRMEAANRPKENR